MGPSTCAGDDDDEAAAPCKLPQDAQVLTESCCVRNQVGGHGGLGLGLLQAALQLGHLQL